MKKKNLFGWLAMTVMLVGTGCSTDEVVNDFSQDNAIQFGTYVGRNAVSRATEITTATLGTQGFGVFASYTKGEGFDATKHGSNFMYNQKVENTSNWDATNKKFASDWEYTPIKYWPNNVNDKVSFFAYAPHSTTKNSNVTVNDATGAAGYPSVTFTVVSNEIKNQSDLLWATPVLDVSKNNEQTPVDIDDKVTFNFHHALSRIAFEVQTMIDKDNPDTDGTKDDDNSGNGIELDAKTKVVVKEVTLSGNFYTGGTLIWDAQKNAAVTGTPATVTSPTTFKLGTSHFANTETVQCGAKDSKYKVEGQSVDRTEKQLNAVDSYIMIVPQKFETGNNLTIKVTYDVVTEDGNLSLGYSAVTNEISTSFNGIEFKAGKAYKFSLHLGMTTVKLEAEVVDEWEDAEDWAVNVPLNIADDDKQTTGGTTQP